MTIYVVSTLETKTYSCEYGVEADSPEEARRKFENQEFEDQISKILESEGDVSIVSVSEL